MIRPSLSVLCCLAAISPSLALINTDWPTLNREVTIRYFSPDDYYYSQDGEEIWQKMGVNITCAVDDTGSSVSLSVPPNFRPDLSLKILTHGFASKCADSDKTSAVEAWMEKYGKTVSVILVDWANLASFTGWGDWDNYVYDWSARNSIDVGEFVGRCLAELSVQQNIKGENFHIVGHSLGSHLMGKAGRIFTANHPNSELIGRLTGLDPAGPRFVDGPYVDAIPELAENIISKESAAFVDIIHTNGAFEPCVVCTTFRSGTILQLGHMDFYPDGGSAQHGCTFGQDAMPGGICSHTRSEHYFINSIREPLLFGSKTCATVEDCNNQIESGTEVVAYMGETAPQYYTGQRSMYHNYVEDCHWSYYEHNQDWCFRQ